MDFLLLILDRDVVIGLALVGAVIATIGSFCVRQNERRNVPKKKSAKMVLYFGYLITWMSVIIFIIMGFAGVGQN